MKLHDLAAEGATKRARHRSLEVTAERPRSERAWSMLGYGATAGIVVRRRELAHWTWSRALRRASEVLRAEGVRSLWYGVLAETVYRRVMLMERSLAKPIAGVTARIPVTIDQLTQNEIEEYIAFQVGADAEEIHLRLAAGHRAFVARYKGRIVHAAWAAVGRAWIDYLDCEYALEPKEVYQYGSYTLPGFRGYNIAALRITKMVNCFHDAGYERSVAAVVPHNASAFRPLVKTGYRPYGTLGYIKVGKWRRDFRHQIRPV
ncbi:MAG: hypothetical protein ACRDGA_14180 [Bacteroidota bacterium]